MALPKALLPERATHQRLSDSIITTTPFGFSLTTSWSHTEAAHVEVGLSNVAAGVTITVFGTLAGLPASESFYVPAGGSGYARSLGTWNAVTAISSISVSGATLSARMTFPSGQPASVLQTVTEAVPIRKQQHRFPLLVEAPEGPVVKQRWIAFANQFSAIAGDVLIIDGVYYQVESIEDVFNRGKFNHLELELHYQRG